MTHYRIYTEDVNRAGIHTLTESAFDAYTLIPSQGVWKGKRERSLIIEVGTEDSQAIHALATAIKALNHQEAVLVTKSVIESELV